MKSILFRCVACLVPFTAVALHGEDVISSADDYFFETLPYDGRFRATECDMAVYRLLVNQDLMWTFISHPKASAYFFQEKAKVERVLFSIEKGLLELKEQFSHIREIGFFADAVSLVLEDLRQEGSLYRDQDLIAFLSWGILNTDSIQDPNLKVQARKMQTDLFKEWLSLEGISSSNDNLLRDLLQFAKGCKEVPLLQKLFTLLSREIEKHPGQFELWDVVGFYTGIDEAAVSYIQNMELDQIYGASQTEEGDFSSDISSDYSSSSDEYSDWDFTEETLAFQALEEFLEKSGPYDFFIPSEWIQLFFEVMQETYPEQKAFFLKTQQESQYAKILP